MITASDDTCSILTLPDSIILNILEFLQFQDVATVAQVCSQWRRISGDEMLWRQMFLKHYNLPPSTVMPNCAKSWKSEFKRLYDETPICPETLVREEAPMNINMVYSFVTLL